LRAVQSGSPVLELLASRIELTAPKSFGTQKVWLGAPTAKMCATSTDEG
jgi:hypothetical protein